MTVHAITREIDRLATIGNRYKDPDNGTRAIAKQLDGTRGVRQSQKDCALARHLQPFTADPVRVTRYEVFVGEHKIPLNNPPGDRLILREFVCAFDDHPNRFPRLREKG